MKKVLLISNGKCSQELGQKIDEFDGPILRFNNYEISGYEKFVGTRTDFLAQRACSDIKKQPPSQLHAVFLFVTYSPLMKAMRSVAEGYKKWYLDKAIIVEKNETVKTHVKCGYNTNIFTEKRKCSIGILAVDYLVGLGYTPYLHNFNFDDAHYFKKQPVDSRYHDFGREKLLLQDFIDNGKVFHYYGE